MLLFPNAKINLGLHILKKLADGYHAIETVFFPTTWCDILELVPSNPAKTQLQVTGIELDSSPFDNLCYKAYKMLADDYTLPNIDMYLHKLLPAGAGLGGGSADAAFTLKGLNELLELKIPAEKLQAYAARLGSDCAFFMLNEPCLATNKGEILQAVKVNLGGYWLGIVKPPIHVSTPAAYAKVKPMQPAMPLAETITRPVEEWKNLLNNDFEASVFEQFPEIKEVKAKLYEAGAVYASLSGSGSAVFGLFYKEIDLTSHFHDNYICHIEQIK